MKIFLWLVTLALMAVCFSCWAMSGLIMKSLADTREPETWPAITILLFHPNTWILFYPAVWIIYSTILTFKRELTPRAVFIFTGTVILGVALLLCPVVIAAVVPFLRMKV